MKKVYTEVWVNLDSGAVRKQHLSISAEDDAKANAVLDAIVKAVVETHGARVHFPAVNPELAPPTPEPTPTPTPAPAAE